MQQKRVNMINARKIKNLTQTQLAEKVGLPKQSISNIEAGLASTVAENWDKLEDILCVPQRKLREIFEVEEVYHLKGKEKPE